MVSKHSVKGTGFTMFISHTQHFNNTVNMSFQYRVLSSLRRRRSTQNLRATASTQPAACRHYILLQNLLRTTSMYINKATMLSLCENEHLICLIS